MHGSPFTGDCIGALNDLADDYDRRLPPPPGDPNPIATPGHD
jgi:hypothetical protein